MQTLTINGVPLENYGLAVTDFAGWLSAPKRTYPTATLPNRIGQVALSVGSTMDPRVITLGWLSQPTSLADGRAKLNSVLQALRGQLEIATVDDPTKVCYGVFDSAGVDTSGVALLGLGHQVLGQLVCHDPLWYDQTPTSIAIAAPNTPYIVPVGSAPSRRTVLTIEGPCTNPTVIVKNNAGLELQRMTFAALTIASGAYLTIDNDLWSAKLSDGTNENGAFGSLESFLKFDPMDGPTIEIDVVSGSAVGVLYCYRSYFA